MARAQCHSWWAGTGSNRRPCGFQSLDPVCNDAEIRGLRCSVGIWQGKPEQGLAGFSLTATMTVALGMAAAIAVAMGKVTTWTAAVLTAAFVGLAGIRRSQ